jgi:hypothetical protein
MMNSSMGFFRWYTSSGGGYTDIMTDYITRVTTEGGTLTDDEKTAINLLTENADIAEFDRLWVHGLQNEIAARTSVVNALTADLITNVNSTTFTAGEGFTGNGTTMYLDTNYSAFSDGVNYTKNSISFGCYALLNPASDNSLLMGFNQGSCLSYVSNNFASLGGVSMFTANSAANSTGTTHTGDGMHSALRTSSNSSGYYKNGVLDIASVVISQNLEDRNLYLLARNNAGAASNFSVNKLSFSFIGSGAVDQAQFYTDVQTLGTTLGWAV